MYTTASCRASMWNNPLIDSPPSHTHIAGVGSLQIVSFATNLNFVGDTHARDLTIMSKGSSSSGSSSSSGGSSRENSLSRKESQSLLRAPSLLALLMRKPGLSILSFSSMESPEGSSSNSFRKTFSGVDIMGARLANEVKGAIGRSGQKLRVKLKGVDEVTIQSDSLPMIRPLLQGWSQSIFISLATPHLGCRDNQNLPFLFGLVPLERLAPRVSHLFIGRTGKHLFLADGRQPLLELMVTDCPEGRFLSALRSFKQRTAYANVGYDHMVGWRTASIRKEGELPEVLTEAVDPKYPHIVREETVIAREGNGSVPKDAPAKDLKEEVMVSGLQQLPWWRIDVNFSKAKPYYAAHNLIQVKVESQHGDGEDVIRHVIDKHFLDFQASVNDRNRKPPFM